MKLQLFSLAEILNKKLKVFPLDKKYLLFDNLYIIIIIIEK